ncbi:protein TonB [Brevundimonas faecalis]|uniref:Protein TonB n=2 Tax=Brevundimonas faecalis TaxID=947378 RepID=A0ABV2RF53_9CAUL
MTMSGTSTAVVVEPQARRSRRRRSAWGRGVAASLLLHAAPLLIASGFWATRPEAVQIPDQVFEVELVRMQAPPRPPSEQPPGPQQTEAATAPAQPRPPIQPRPSTAVPANVETLPLTVEPEPTPTVSAAPPAPATTAPPARPAPPASVAASAQTWEGMLLAHLERRKRYPAEARAQRRQGVAYVRFAMTRDGRVLSAELERSSGYPALDREAVALLRRAQPLPKPPPEVPGDPVSLSVPVEFFMRSR